MKEILQKLSPEALISILLFIVTSLGVLTTRVTIFVKNALIKEFKKLMNDIEGLKADNTSLRKAMTSHGQEMVAFQFDMKSAFMIHKDSLLNNLNASIEKFQHIITELNEVTTNVSAETHILSEVFKANVTAFKAAVETLDYKMTQMQFDKKDLNEQFGKIKVIEDKLNRNINNITQIVGILKTNGMIKGK